MALGRIENIKKPIHMTFALVPDLNDGTREVISPLMMTTAPKICVPMS